jgi:hypothetical protein
MLLDDMLNTNPLSVVEYTNRKLKESLPSRVKIPPGEQAITVACIFDGVEAALFIRNSSATVETVPNKSERVSHGVFRFQNHLHPSPAVGGGPSGVAPGQPLSLAITLFTCTLPR